MNRFYCYAFRQRFLVLSGAFMLALLVSSDAFAQQLRFQHLTSNNGLESSTIHGLFVDSRKFLWIQGMGVLSRFDGARCINYYASDEPGSFSGYHFQSRLAEDSQGNLWFLTDAGLMRWNRSNATFDRLPAFHLPENRDGLRLFAGKKGEIMVSDDFHSGWIFRSDTNTITEVNPLPIDSISGIQLPLVYYFKGVHILHSAQSGNSAVDSFLLPGRHFSSSDQGIMQNDSICWLASDEGLMRLNINDHSHRLFPEYAKTGFMERWKNNLYVGHPGGLLVFDMNQQKYLYEVPFDESSSDGLLPGSRPELMTGDGTLFLVSFKGISYVNVEKLKFEHYLDRQSAARSGTDCFVRCLAEDKIGNIWCGTQEGGLLVMNREKEILYQYKNIETSVLPSHQTERGFEHLYCDERGHMWISGFRGLSVFNPEKKSFTTHHGKILGLPDVTDSWSFASGVHADRILALENYGSSFLFGYSAGQTTMPLAHMDLSGTCFCTMDREILLGNADGLYRMEETGEGYVVSDTLIKGVNVKCIVDAHDAGYWVGTTSGLYKWDPHTGTTRLFRREEGLPHNYIYGIVPLENELWLSTQKGMSRMDLGTYAFRNYNLSDGLQGMEFNTHAFLATSWGEIWMGGLGGLNTFYPDSVRDYAYPSSVQVTRVLINDREEPLLLNPGEISQLELEFVKNTLQFDITAIDYADVASCLVQCKLEGYDDDWITLTNPGMVRYPNLPHGRYTLVIKATNSDGIPNKEEKRISILIRPPWYNTYWFYGICVLGSLLFIYLVYRIRLAQVMKMQHMRNKISRDLHDDVGSTLGSLSMYSEVARQRVRKGKPADDVLEKIGKTSRETIEKMSDIVWSVKSDNDTMDHMIQRMKSYATILFAPQHADVRFEVAPGIEHIKLNMNQRRNVFLIFKEAVYNAAKYADCKLLEVTFTTDKKSLTMIIADNGRGFEFPISNELGGNGLENMRTRAMEVGGTLEIESHKLSGTRLTLRMKL